MDLIKVLKADCDFPTLSIKDQMSLILQVILLAIENQDFQIETAKHQNLIFANDKNVNKLQHNNRRYIKCKWDSEDEEIWKVKLEMIYMQATKAMVKKVKTVAEL